MHRDKKKNQDRGPRKNRQIKISPVRVIDDEGNQLGVIPTSEALRLAEDQGKDLVEVQPNTRPPVCKIIDFGKWKYDQKKKQNEAKKKQKKVELKEVKFRPKTDTHDFEVKTGRIEKFLGEGNRVKVTIMFRGREMIHTDLGFDIMQRVVDTLDGQANIDSQPKMEGRNMHMILSPNKKKQGKKDERSENPSG